MANREKSEANYQGTALQIKNRLLAGVILTLIIGGLAILSGFIFQIYRPDRAGETYLIIAVLTIGGILFGSYLTLRLLSQSLKSINRVEKDMFGLVNSDQKVTDVSHLLKKQPPSSLNDAYLSMLKRIGETEDEHLDFLSIVAHEIRSPLATIINYTEVINDPDFNAGQDFFQNSCEVILRQGLKVCEFTDDILTLAEIEMHRLQLNFEMLPLAPFLERVIEEANVETRRHVSFENYAGDVVVWGDALLVREALFKLIERCNFRPDLHEPVTIQLRKSDSEKYVEIPVSGPGTEFNSSERAIIKKCFSEPNLKPQDLHGSWLGLFIAKSIIQSHHGNISLVTAPDIGTGFTVRMPIATDIEQVNV